MAKSVIPGFNGSGVISSNVGVKASTISSTSMNIDTNEDGLVSLDEIIKAMDKVNEQSLINDGGTF